MTIKKLKELLEEIVENADCDYNIKFPKTMTLEQVEIVRENIKGYLSEQFSKIILEAEEK